MKMDEQTLAGKVVMGVAEFARKYYKPVLAIVGKNELSEKQLASIGLQKIIPLVDEKTNHSESMKNTSKIITERVVTRINLEDYC